jgi:DNA mismatch endonuclease (patch repair protein)
MTDVFTKAKRSEVMSRIRSKGNARTELRLIAIMKEAGVTGWRRHQPVFGKPDFVFRPEKVAVFVDGCFWHGCPKCYRRPKSNRKFWDAKVARNRARDLEVTKALRKAGWRVVRLWEHQLKQPGRVVWRLRVALGAGQWTIDNG